MFEDWDDILTEQDRAGLDEYYGIRYDTNNLINPDNLGSPWSSNINGRDAARYTPTSGYNRESVQTIEGKRYYQDFTNYLIDNFYKDGKISPFAETWMKATDELLPSGSVARFYDENGNLRSSWSPRNKDVYSRAPQTFTNVLDYIRYIRNDNIAGARHNIYKRLAVRYYYLDKDNNKHYININWLKNNKGRYAIENQENPDLSISPDGLTELSDYRISLKKENEGETSFIPEGNNDDDKNKKPSFGDRLNNIFKNINSSDLLEGARLGLNLWANNLIYKNAKNAIRPDLLKTYRTHRRVEGDEYSKQQFYKRAAALNTKASRPITSNMDQLMSYRLEAQRQGDEYRALGDLLDNQRIKETRAESATHEDNNIARANLVANTNMASINKALLNRAILANQKLAADRTSIDNWLSGREYKALKREELRRRINFSLALNNLQVKFNNEYDTTPMQWKDENGNIVIFKYKDKPITYPEAKEIMDRLQKKSDDKITEEERESLRELIKASAKYTLYMQLKQQKEYADLLYEYSFKKGGKIKVCASGSKTVVKTNEAKNAELLYKKAKDSVDHFYRMSKLVKSKSKLPPKALPLKYQEGGIAPFGVYTPLASAGKDTITTNKEDLLGGSKKGEDNKDKLDEVIKLLLGHLEGLPSDVDVIADTLENQLKIDLLRRPGLGLGLDILGGGGLSTVDLEIKAIRALRMANTAKFNMDLLTNAATEAGKKGGLNEFATDSYGNLVVQDMDTGNLKRMTYEEYLKNKENYNPLTNQQLVTLRSYDKKFANNPEIANIVGNATSMDEIHKRIKAFPFEIGTTEVLNESLKTKKEILDLQKGFEILSESAEDGIYKLTNLTKSLQALVNMALEYTLNQLSLNELTILKIHSEGKPKELLMQLFASSMDFTNEIRVDYDKASNGIGEDGKKSKDEVMSPQYQLIAEVGGRPGQITIRPGGDQANGNGYSSTLIADATIYPSLEGAEDDMSLKQMLSKTKIQGILNSNTSITFGDKPISPDNFKDILFSNDDDKAVVTLPILTKNNGSIQVDFSLVDQFLNVLNKINEWSRITGKDKNTEEYQRQFAQYLKEELLTELIDPVTGQLDRSKVGLFLVVQGYTSDRVLKGDDANSGYIENITDVNKLSSIEKRMNDALSTNADKTNYEFDVKDHWFEFGYDEVYKAPIFIPLNANPVSAQLSGGVKQTMSQVYRSEAAYLNYNKMAKLKDTKSENKFY